MTHIEPKLAVIGIGGNALIRDADRASVEDQAETVEATIAPIVTLIQDGWRVILTHGNGPQVGNVLRRSEIAADEVATVSLDYACADIQGAVGYMFERAFANEFQRRGMENEAVAIVTQVLVDQNDPAMSIPRKPIGQYYDIKTAAKMAHENGWDIAEDSGRGWRRVVPSPEPLEIIELNQIRTLVDANFTVISCGGGGIPIFRNKANNLQGIEAIIDKDLTSSLLALQFKADYFVLTTGVEKVAMDFGTPQQRWFDTLDYEEAQTMLAEGVFAGGSMAPKIDAMLRYLSHPGGTGIITCPDKILDAILCKTGTHFSTALTDNKSQSVIA
jgi:carbamate kinase